MTEQNKKSLPLGIKFIGWTILIISLIWSSVGLIMTLKNLSNGSEYIIESLIVIVILLIFIVVSIFLIKGAKFARILFIIFFLAVIVQSIYVLFNMDDFPWDLTLILRLPLSVWAFYYLLFNKNVKEAFKK